MMAERRAAEPPKTAIERMQRMEEMSKLRQAEMGEARKSVETFYATLSDAQKTVFDAEFEKMGRKGRARHEGRRSARRQRHGAGPRLSAHPIARLVRGPGPPFGWPGVLMGRRRQARCGGPDTADAYRLVPTCSRLAGSCGSDDRGLHGSRGERKGHPAGWPPSPPLWGSSLLVELLFFGRAGQRLDRGRTALDHGGHVVEVAGTDFRWCETKV